jgi:hypothetical protein
MIARNVTSEPVSIGYISLVHKDYITFIILTQEVNLISDECYFGRNTVAEINNKYHYLGSEIPTIGTAILAWQEVNGRELDQQELRQIMIDNHIL